MALKSNILVVGALSRGTGTGSTTISSPFGVKTLTVRGLIFSSAELTTVSNTFISFDDVGGVHTFDNVAWTGFTGGFTGGLFTVNNPGSPITFSGHNFSGAGFTADASSHFVNSLSNSITMSGANPASGTSGTHYIGTVSWP